MKNLYKSFLPLFSLAMPAIAQEKPNLVVIIADQWRGDALGWLGKEPVRTPCLDRLAENGVNFTNAVSSYPVSSPARAMLMTGLYPPHSKVTGNCNSENTPYDIELATEARCWSDVLSEQKYDLAYIGKWHLDAPRKPYVDTYNNKWAIAWNEWCEPSRRHGFKYWEAYGTYDYHLRPMYWSTNDTRDNFHYVDKWGPEYEADKAIEYISSPQRQNGKPFALVVSMNPPHTGYELVPEKYKEMYRDIDVEAICKKRPDIMPSGTKMGDYFRRNICNYYACMTGVDENVGRIVAELKNKGLLENTIVVFTSDHGIQMGAHEIEGKDIFYDSSMRIPLIISWQGKIKPRKDAKTSIAFADLYPTLLSLLGQKRNIPKEVQTNDLSTLILEGKEDKDIVQPYYFLNPNDSTTGYRGLRGERYTFVQRIKKGVADSVMLFDREADPYQMKNIAKEEPKLTDEWKAKLRTWLIKNNDPFAQYMLPKPTKTQLKWHDAEIGVVFHYDLHVFDGIRYGQGNNRINPIEDYNIFNPTQLNTDQWVEAAKKAGAKFAVITATHETGFGLWQSDVNPYCLKAVKWGDGKGDVVRDFCNSCRKYGIEPGIYIGIRWNSLFGIHNFRAEGGGDFAKNRQAWYRRYCERITKELCTRYGKLFMVWYDGGADDPRGDGPDVERIVAKYQPDCLFYHNIDRADFRWGGSESGTVKYPCWSSFPIPSSHHKKLSEDADLQQLLKHGDPNGNYWVPAMADTPLRATNGRHEWFWEPNDENNLLSVEALMDMYEKSVGRNATIIVGVTPDTTGLIPQGDVERLASWGQEIKRKYGAPIATISERHSKETIIKLNKPRTINRFVIEENIASGERIREYKVEALVRGKWKTICKGESVGHKRIETTEPTKTSQVKLLITKSIGNPYIKSFSVY